MQPTSPTAEWTIEHRDVYEAFVKQVLEHADEYVLVKKTLGHHVLEELERQMSTLQFAKTQIGVAFDIRQESSRFCQGLQGNADYLDGRVKQFSEEFNPECDRILAALQNEKYMSQLTEHGKVLAVRTRDVAVDIRHVLNAFPLRYRALTKSFALTYNVINVPPTPTTLKYALESLWESVATFYYDFHGLVRHFGTSYLQRSKELFAALDRIEVRIAAKEEAERRSQEEAEEEERRARLAEEEEETRQLELRNSEPDTYSSRYDDSNDYYSNYNPATGLPTCGAYGVDVMGNSYGTTDHMY